MKILVTGGNSFIGLHILKEISSTHRIFATYRKYSKKFKKLNKKNLKKIKINLAKITDYKKLPKRLDLIIHAAGTSDDSLLFSREVYQSNILGSINLLHYAKNAGVKRIIFLSSISAYGCVQSKVVDSRKLGTPNNLYGASKAIFEKLLQSEKNSISSISLRLPGVVGHGCPKRAWLPKTLEAIRKNKNVSIYNPLAKINNILYVGHLAKFITKLCLIKRTMYDVFPLASKRPISVKSIIEEMITISKSQSKIKIKKRIKSPFLVSNKQAKKIGFKPQTVLQSLRMWVNEA